VRMARPEGDRLGEPNLHGREPRGGDIYLYDEAQTWPIAAIVVGAEVNLSGTSANNRVDEVYIAC
jgi:hypothetical protein